MSGTRGTLVLFIALLQVGCSPSEFDASVSGTITLDGEPVPPGVVIFAPMEKGPNASRGAIGASGRYSLITKHEHGIGSGNYRVAVRVFEKGDPPGPGEFIPPTNFAPLVPEKYLDVKTSGLEYAVTPGSNTIDIELVSQ